VAKAYLVTGGAGFIGRYLCDELLRHGHKVRVLDGLIEQVHGPAMPLGALPPDVEFVEGDVRDALLVYEALDGVDGVFHLAAEVGVGQSMYEIARYVGANDLGTAVVLGALIERPVARLVVASSMSVYGEGLYLTEDGGRVTDARRRAGVGPPLGDIKERVYIAGRLTNTPEHLIDWIVDPRVADPKTAMPATGVSKSEARDIAAYLLSLQ
jgi:nucleoside-diphosphate-sugar epimerase